MHLFIEITNLSGGKFEVEIEVYDRIPYYYILLYWYNKFLLFSIRLFTKAFIDIFLAAVSFFVYYLQCVVAVIYKARQSDGPYKVPKLLHLDLDDS